MLGIRRSIGLRVAATAACALALTSVAAVPTFAKTEIKLCTCFGSSPQKEALEAIVARFEQQNPDISVTNWVPATGGADYVDKVLTSIAGGITPNVVWVAPERFSSLYDRMVVPLSELQRLGPKLDLSTFYGGLVNPQQSYKNTLWGVPFENSTLALGWNKTLLAQAGIAGPPKTWSELTSMCVKLTDKDKGLFGIDTYMPDWYMPMLYAQKGVPMVSDNKVMWASKAGIEAVTWFSELWTKYHVTGGSFANGKSAFTILGGWDYPNMKKVKKLNFDVAALPYADGGQPASLITYKELLVMKSDNKKVAASWKLERFIMENKNFVEWCMRTGYLPVTRTQAAVPDYKQYLDANPGIGVMLQQSETGCRMLAVPSSDKVWGALSDALSLIQRGKKSVEQALTDSQATAQVYLRKAAAR